MSIASHQMLAAAVIAAVASIEKNPDKTADERVFDAICAEEAAKVGDIDLKTPLKLLLMGWPRSALAWAKTIYPGWTNTELFVYGVQAGSVGNGLAIGGYKGNVSLAIAEMKVDSHPQAISELEAKMNARRLAAAWNICQGVSLELLEYMATNGMNISGEANIQNIQTMLDRSKENLYD
jgi:hypothetical protein